MTQFWINTYRVVLICLRAYIDEFSILDALINVTDYFPRYGSTAIIIYQSYEWMNMIDLINAQQGKSIGEIMYNLNDSAFKNRFVKVEKIKRNLFKLIVYWIFISDMLESWFHHKYDQRLLGKYYRRIIMVTFPSLLILYIFSILLYKLYRYHKFFFYQIFKGIFLFSILEIGISAFVMIKIGAPD